MRVTLTLKSANRKTGPMPVSTTSADTCPPSCPLQGAGCYAALGHVGMHWRKVTNGKTGTDWSGFCASVASLPADTLWRHNQAGDLPGAGDRIDAAQLRELVGANQDKRGFTYTHKPVAGSSYRATHNRRAVAAANRDGFTINLSANTLAHADELAQLEIGPVVVVLDAPEGIRADTHTPAGRKVATCPATYRGDVTCLSCGLCQRQNRKVIVGFPAHGQQRAAAASIARG